VAESLELARAALGWLRAHGETALLFAPPADGPAVAAGSLAGQVQAAGAPAAVARALLGEALLVAELPERPAAGAPPGRVWVTRSGEWMSAAGGVCGGAEAADRALAAAQGRRREVERLEAAIRELQIRLQRLEGERTAAGARRQELAAAAQAAGEEAARVRAETETARRAVERERQNAARADERQRRLAAESERLARERGAAQAQLEEAERAPATGGGPAGGAAELDAAAARAQAAEAAWRGQEAVVADLRVLGAQCERAAEGAAQEARRLAGAVAQLERECSTRLAAVGQLERELAALANPADAPDEAAVAATELESVRAALGAAAASRQEVAARAAAAARDARAFTDRRQELVERSHRAEIEHTAVEAERRRLADQWRECAAALAAGVEERPTEAATAAPAARGPADREGPPPDEAPPAPAVDPPGDAGEPDELTLDSLFRGWDARAAEEALARVPDPEAEVRRLRRQLRNLGAIRPDAVAEHARQSERYAFLTAQRQDLEAAREQVLAAIQEIDAASKETFQKAFVEIGAAFQEMFQQLFGGGHAELRLTDPDDVLETGIEVLVQPPGKRRQNLLLLSGGERALTATAMLFALLKIRPSPFVVMDEVDAPLDEANVARFGETLRAFAAKTQFIVVTHNRGTMEAVDTLYGVTMQERGVSRVLSCTLTDDLVRESEGRPVERERAGTAPS
jgi:chromosome segregation protein